MACKAGIQPCGRFGVSRQAITPARWCGLMTVGMMADRSSVIGLTREYRPNWSVSMILCRDFDRPQWVRIPKVALHYTKSEDPRIKKTSRYELRSNPYIRIDANASGECGHLPVFSPRKRVFSCASERFAGLTTTGFTVAQGETALPLIVALYPSKCRSASNEVYSC